MKFLVLFLLMGCGNDKAANPQVEISRLESHLKIVQDTCAKTGQTYVEIDGKEYNCIEATK